MEAHLYVDVATISVQIGVDSCQVWQNVGVVLGNIVHAREGRCAVIIIDHLISCILWIAGGCLSERRATYVLGMHE